MKIKSYSYNRGIKNPAPQLTSFSLIKEISVPEPERVRIPVKQIKGVSPSVVVTRGERVKKGTRLAVSGDKVILSSVSGVVEKVYQGASIYGGQSEIISIISDNKNEQELFKKYEEDSSAEQLMMSLRRFSIVDYDGVDLVSKIEALSSAVDKTLVVNLLTDEPYELNTPFLLSQKSEDVAHGVLTMATIIKASKIVIAVKKGEEKLYGEFLNLIQELTASLDVSVALLPNVYPVGDEVILTRVLTKNKKMENLVDVREAGYIAVDAFSLYALKKLVREGEVVDTKPLTIIDMVGGKIESFVAWIKIGATLSDVLSSLDSSGMSGIKKMVAGGPMRGVALVDADAGITFNLKAIMAIKNNCQDEKPELQCITCGRCVKACPHNIVPYEIDEHVINNDFNEAIKLGADKCTRCGVCSYVCPSKRYLTQRIYYSKEIINNKGLKNE